ncbi:MAG: glutathione transferase GstA [Methylobacteriaceae bacterium]|nr:glutathione transferase GstA [Methylobacteriaceae bacterium]
MKLYYSPGACSLSPHIVAMEAGLPMSLHKVDLRAKTMEGGGDYLAVNPKGYVPALEIQPGVVLTEGPAIVQYLADMAPQSGLAPKAGTLERARLQEWLNFISTELHKVIGSMFNPAQTAEWKAAMVALAERRLGWLDGQLAGKAFLMGDTFTAADAYLFTVLNWTKMVGIDATRWSNVAAYMGRVGARPKVQEALKAEGLMK